MFTGIVAAVGQIVRVEALGTSVEDGVRLWVDAGELDLADVKLGDSIAIQGACMTVTSLQAPQFSVDVSQESLQKTVGLAEPGPVNLEKALCLGDALGGHLLSGHVDGIGQVQQFAPYGESHRLVVRLPAAFAPYLAYKGSVAINGVSLTVNEVVDHADGADVQINLIPHTVAVTTLRHLTPGATVNFEVDLIARYVQRMMTVAQAR